MPLHVVPAKAQDPAQQVVQRVKKMARPDGMLQCNRCGGRTSMTSVNGAFVKNGRKQGGTVIDKDVCADCKARGITSSMLPTLKRVE